MIYTLWTMHFLHKKTLETCCHGVAMTYCVAECKSREVRYINTNAAESTASMFRRVTPKRQLIPPGVKSVVSRNTFLERKNKRQLYSGKLLI